MTDQLIIRFNGPLHGVVWRQKEDGSHYTREFNTQAHRLPWSEGEFQGNYDMTEVEALDDFCSRVERLRRTAEGDLRCRHEHEERLRATVTPAAECVLLEVSGDLAFLHTVHDSASTVSMMIGVARCPLKVLS